MMRGVLIAIDKWLTQFWALVYDVLELFTGVRFDDDRSKSIWRKHGRNG